MLAIAIGCFILIFVLVTLTVAVSLRYLEAQKRKRVAAMLENRISAVPVQETQLLLEPADKETAITKLLQRLNLADTLENLIQQAGLEWTLNTFLLASVGLTIPGALLGAKIDPLGNPGVSALACALALSSLPYLHVRRVRAKRLAEFEAQLPEALDFLSRAMRSGHAFSIALEMLSDETPQPLSGEFRKVFNEQNLGLPVETALKNLAVRVPLVDVSFFVSAVLLQKETGGNLNEILTRLAYIIRERFKLKGQVRAASAHGRVTGAILTLLPIALAVGLLVISPGYLQGMANDEHGRYMIGGAITGLLLGHTVIQKIVKIKV